jgi:hypothetical protein
MTIATIRLRLASLQASIPGVIKAYPQLPRGIVKTNEMPLFMTFVREADYDLDTVGDGDFITNRTYLMWLLVKPVAEGEEGEGESLAEPWVETVANFFLARPSLGNLTGIMNSYMIKDSGPKKLVWPGTPANPTGVYWGVEFQLRVAEFTKRIYANNE